MKAKTCINCIVMSIWFKRTGRLDKSQTTAKGKADGSINLKDKNRNRDRSALSVVVSGKSTQPACRFLCYCVILEPIPCFQNFYESATVSEANE